MSAAPADAATGDMMILSFASIIKQVPQELWGHLAPAGVAGLNFPVARQQVLGQLAQGAVKVMFGELRQRAPKGVFIDSTAHDHELICLPLADILAQLHPDAYARRSNQTALTVPTEIADVFGPRGEGASALRVADKSTSPTRPP
ncbi:MAG TPA: hypothetical protein VNO52_09300, partial [Methylomirabilota bacterium]|nr:hypothetical protein [Methylomirabilota bacterium]